ncbi:MAG: hypothetical protein Q7S16_04150 [bacterium]|nr:hypothetical protein [bacterium]
MVDKPTLLEYFEQKSKTLLASFELSKQQNASLNLGNNRENFVKDFLRIVLPPRLKNIYDGEIIDKDGKKTGQLDLLIIRDDAPCIDYGGSNSYLAEGVFAVIEIKSNLDKEKLLEAKKTLEKVSSLSINPSSVILGSAHIGRPLRILFAYSGSELHTLFSNLSEENAFDVFDLVCVLDKGVIISRGRLLNASFDKQNKDQTTGHNFIIKGNASALGFLYYYLVQCGTSFSVGSISVENYFQPLSQWGSIETIFPK